jgi:hypothetical protein
MKELGIKDLDELRGRYDSTAALQLVKESLSVFEIAEVVMLTGRFTHEPEKNELKSNFACRVESVSLDDRTAASVISYAVEAIGPVVNDTRMAARVNATFKITYRNESNLEPSADQSAVFASVNGIYHSWSYLRPFVDQCTAHMGIRLAPLPMLPQGAACDMAGFRAKSEASQSLRATSSETKEV